MEELKIANAQPREAARQKATQNAAEILLEIRSKRGISQARLAEISGRKQSYISRVESRQQNISLATLQEIVDAVGGNLFVKVEL